MPVTDGVETFDANSNEVIDDNEDIDENDMSENNRKQTDRTVDNDKKSPDPEPEGGSGKQTQAIFLLTAITVSLFF